ncbi:MAG TPA: methanogenesis marker 17 protein [Methanosarcinaceae archaeon]|nr:methanogenesis marker 17 protein [Methanosarcinaceae archaeon]
MSTLDTFVVESTISAEADHYKQIVSDAITDLVLAQSIEHIKVVIKPEDTLFQMAIVLRSGLSPVKVTDFAEVGVGTFGKEEVVIDIDNEAYLPQLLENLWTICGRINVHQPERKTVSVSCENPLEHISEIEEIVIEDPQRTLHSRLVDMAIRATPEGFRVRYHSLNGNHFIFVATEDIMKNEWIKEAHKMLAEFTGGESHGNSA